MFQRENYFVKKMIQSKTNVSYLNSTEESLNFMQDNDRRTVDHNRKL